MIKKTRVNTYFIELICDKCGEVMKSSGMTLMSNPPQYKYICSCGNSVTTNKHYPHLDYEYVGG